MEDCKFAINGRELSREPYEDPKTEVRKEQFNEYNK
jgi:hypothetical protein